MDITLLGLLYAGIGGVIFLFLSLCLFIVVTTKPFPDLSRSEDEKYFYDEVRKEKCRFPSLDDSASVSLSVVVPAYNEETRLPPMLDECLQYLEKRCTTNKDFTYEVIIVSDGSKDKTVKVGHKYTSLYGSDKVRVLNLKPNRGKGGAVQLGVLCSRGEHILFADADGATKFSDITKLEAAMCNSSSGDNTGGINNIAIACGSRAHLEEESIASRSVFRTILMHGFHSIVYFLAVRTVQDTQCGFKLFTRESARTLFYNLHVTRWAFDVELLYLAERLKIGIAEVAVTWHEIDGSKIVPVLSWLQMGKDLVMIWLRYKLNAWRIRPVDKQK